MAILRRQDCMGWPAVGLVMWTLLANDVHGQVPPVPLPPIDPTGRSGEPPPLREERPLKPKPQPLVPPPAPPAAEEKGRLPAVRVFVREFRLTGNTVFTDEELGEVTASYVNRELTTEDLESIRLGLTRRYVERGYVTSGAIIPDQAVTDGVIRIQIIEGILTRIVIEGTENFWPYYFRNRIALGAGPPVNVNTLQERLQLLQQDPRLIRLNAELRPGVVRGESELHVKVAEASPYRAWLVFNNYQSPSVGAERGLGTVSHQSLTGNGDVFTFTYGHSQGVDLMADVSYTLPLTAYDTTLTGSYRRNQFGVTEDPFKALSISSESEIIGFSLRQPIYRTVNQQITIALTGEYLYNKVTIFDAVPFNLPGFQRGVAQVAALRFTPEWVHRTRSSVLAARSRFSVGLNVLDATIDAGGRNDPDGQFFSWLGQVQAVKRLDRWWGVQVLGRFDVQLADDRLFALEQYPVGGRFTVRGYRENTFVRDNAIVASLEARVPVIQSARGEDILQIAPFLDYGSAWNSKDETSPAPSARGFLASVGVGLRWNILPQNRARFEVYWGAQLNHIDQGEGNLQDNGIHLQVVAQPF